MSYNLHSKDLTLKKKQPTVERVYIEGSFTVYVLSDEDYNDYRAETTALDQILGRVKLIDDLRRIEYYK